MWVKRQYDKVRQQRDRLQMWVKRQHDEVRQQRDRLQMWVKRQHDKVRQQRVRLQITMYIYHALINALSAHMIHINLNVIFYTHVKHSPTKTIYIKYYLKINK